MEENKNVSAEELAAEQAALQESKEDEIRSKVIAEFGFDEVDDIERIDKLVAKEVEHSKKMSQAIGQKIKWRTEATKPKAPAPAEVKKDNVPQNFDLDKALDARLEKRDLEAMSYPPEIKKEIERVAQITGVTVKQAVSDPYIVAKIADYDRGRETEEASITRTNNSGSKKTFSFDSPPDVDMSTEEGRKTWDAYKADMTKKGY